VVIDGRNLFDPKVMASLGFHYHGIGRGGRSPVRVQARRRLAA
jgi:hypothetical protein